jgi:hypothetical protein
MCDPLFLCDKTGYACLLHCFSVKKKAGTERCASVQTFQYYTMIDYCSGLMEYIRDFGGILYQTRRKIKNTVRNTALLDVLILDAPV